MTFKDQIVVCFVAVVTVVSALYSHTDDVIQLDPKNFHSDVIMSKDIWLIEFYAPWCGHCKSLAPEWKKAATALKGVVKVAAIDCDEHKGLAGQYGVRGFPTIKVFGADKHKPDDYKGQRSASGIVDEALRQLSQTVKDRLSGKSSGGGGGEQKQQSGGGGGGGGDQVVELTDSNFDKLVLESDDLWLVEFFAPWCGHCKNLEPHWKSAASELKGKFKLGAVDATVHNMISQRYGVQGFPTIKFFPADRTEKKNPQEYDGGRTSGDIVNWAMEKVSDNIDPPEVKQLTKEDDLAKACESPLCFIAILPNILDCQSKCRKDYLDTLVTLGDKYKKKMWSYVWAEAGVQPELEESLGIGGFGYPAMAAVNVRKLKYTILKGSFGETGINEFLRDLSFGRGSTAPLKDDKLPTILACDPWDGKDGQLPEEEEIDLSDVELDDLEEDKPKTTKKTEL